MRYFSDTFGTRLDGFRGIGPGFDFVRFFLASGVVLWHTFPATTGTPEKIEATPFWLLVGSMVPMFFALSGYLVTASANRIAVGPYLMNRFARIFPALAVVVLACIFVIGPLVTTYPLGEYFSDSRTWLQLINMIGWHPQRLPGVFENAPFAGIVNASLWTVPYEILCYLMMAGLMVTGLVRHWWVLLGLFLAFTGAAFVAVIVPPSMLPFPVGEILHHPRLAAASKIVPFFILGAIAYLLRSKIPYDHRLAALAFLSVLIAGAVGDPAWQKGPLLWAMIGVPLTYLVVWGGLTRLPKPHVFGGGDFSYGIYLWHFPILQLLVLFFGFTTWWVLGLVAVLPVLAVAALSWNLVEKPALRWRKRYSTVGAQIAAEEKGIAADGKPVPVKQTVV